MNESRSIIYNGDYYVVAANKLVKGAQLMTLREVQLLFIAISQIVKKDKEFQTFTTTVPELASFMGIDENSLYRDLDDICTNLLQRVVCINVSGNPEEKMSRWKKFQWVSCAEYDCGKLTLRLNDEVKPYLLDLNSYYTQSKLKVLMSFGGYYTVRLYQYLFACYGEQRSETMDCSFTVEEIRELFQAEDKYASTRDLVKYTLKFALDEIAASNYAYVTNYQEHHKAARGKPLESVSFSIRFFEDAEKKNGFLTSLNQVKKSLPKPAAISEFDEIFHCAEENFESFFGNL